MDLLEKFNRIFESLNRQQVEYILIGGYAVILHGLPRTTQDIDLVLKMSEDNINRFRKALQVLYDDKDIEVITISELMKYAVIRYGTPDNFYIDVMSKIGEAADYHSIEYEEKTLGEVKIWIATAEALYKLKRDTIRPQDKSDAFFLKTLLKARKKE